MVTLAAVVALLGPAFVRHSARRFAAVRRRCYWSSGCNGYARPSCAPVGTRRCTTKRWCSSRRSAAARRAGVQRRGLVLDWYAFTLSYKGRPARGPGSASRPDFRRNQHTFRWPLLPRSRCTGGGRCRHGGAGAAVSSAREAAEVRRRSHAELGIAEFREMLSRLREQQGPTHSTRSR